jgi:hypothetical protein
MQKNLTTKYTKRTKINKKSGRKQPFPTLR